MNERKVEGASGDRARHVFTLMAARRQGANGDRSAAAYSQYAAQDRAALKRQILLSAPKMKDGASAPPSFLVSCGLYMRGKKL